MWTTIIYSLCFLAYTVVLFMLHLPNIKIIIIVYTNYILVVLIIIIINVNICQI